jgi:protein-L-isoaspartate(D-aspartate) O-methyltransferase
MTEEDVYYTRERLRMVEEQIAGRDIDDQVVLQAMRTVPRHCFVPRENRHLAYADCPLPIGQDQTISQPYIVALMTQLLILQGTENVLEIGTGSGYQAAILGTIAKQVYTIERHKRLAEQATSVLAELGLVNVEVVIGDGSLGWPEHAPYNAILATAAAPRVPQALLDQLADGGRLVLPVGSRGGQYLERWFRFGEKLHREQGVPVAFVPLVGKSGWSEESWNW